VSTRKWLECLKTLECLFMCVCSSVLHSVVCGLCTHVAVCVRMSACVCVCVGGVSGLWYWLCDLCMLCLSNNPALGLVTRNRNTKVSKCTKLFFVQLKVWIVPYGGGPAW